MASPTEERYFFTRSLRSAQASLTRTFVPQSPLHHFSATVWECVALWEITPWPARGGCHERSPERSTTVLLLDRVGYRRCHRGRDTSHLSRSASRGLRSLMLSGPFKPTIWSRAAVTSCLMLTLFL